MAGIEKYNQTIPLIKILGKLTVAKLEKKLTAFY
jgi:hypothetical protein